MLQKMTRGGTAKQTVTFLWNTTATSAPHVTSTSAPHNFKTTTHEASSVIQNKTEPYVNSTSFSLIPTIVVGFSGSALFLAIIGFVVLSLKYKTTFLRSKRDVIVNNERNSTTNVENDALLQVDLRGASTVTENRTESPQYMYATDRAAVLAALRPAGSKDERSYSYVDLASSRNQIHFHSTPDLPDFCDNYIKMQRQESDALYLKILPNEDSKYLSPVKHADVLGNDQTTYENIRSNDATF
ncbi:uncharacterized protein LOC135692521 [Rhopilema esculentum]|uniref:uncharacterized protein LOC135692521 n=1 Tax=Rhopilema esculentum TaxID=499914 RepID=UPI0031DF1117